MGRDPATKACLAVHELCARLALLRYVKSTAAPRSASMETIAEPMPPVPPVTRAIPSRSVKSPLRSVDMTMRPAYQASA